MAQHDYNIANQTGANFRADLNNALSAIASNNSGSSEPSTTFAYEWWIDTSANVLKLRNSANNAWITMPFSITADNTIDINAGTVNGITSFSFSSGATVTSILDEDNLSSDSATALATQQSIKAYVDSQVTAQDLDISDGSSTISIDLDSETLSLLGGTGVTSAASGNGVTFSIGQSVGTSDNVVFNQVTGALVGNSSTATALATARTISGVSFDGTANITLDTDDIGEGSSNLYYTDARFDTRLATKTTDNLTEGSSNKYFTVERVDDQVNTLLTAGANISLTYDDAGGTLTIANTNSADITSVVAGDGLTGGGTSGDVTLAVGVDDSSIEINSDALRVKASGITNAMLGGSITNAKLANSSVTINSQAIALGGSHTFDTDDIGEGSTNLYFTNERTDDRVASLIQNGTGISFTYDDTAGTLTPVITLSPFDTDNLSEGSSNLYYTDTRTNSAIDARVTNTFINNLSGVVADTSTALATARSIAIAGDVVGSASFDGTSDISISAIIQANSVALGTDTSGSYVSTIAGTTNEIEVSGSGSETATVTIGLPDNVTITGNLTVNGTTTTVNTSTLEVEDPLIKLAKANSGADSVDIGFYGLYDTSGSQDLYAGLFRDANDSGKFKLFKDLQVEPTTTVNTSGTGYAVGTLVSNLEGNVTGQVSTLSNHDTDNLSEGSTNLYFTNARSRSAISASGDISYNNSTGVISFTQSSAPVTSVNSATGAVTLDTDDIGEGSTNLYFTNARADTRINLQTGANLDLSSKSTSNLSEGTNLYYTDARFDTRLGTKTTDNLTEGSSNLYMTTERVQDIVGGMVTGNTETGITVTYDDSDGTLDFVVGTLNQDTTGNAATATALETARTIGGVSFDGTGNIDLAGVNTTGNQDTSGNAATATTLATARTIGGTSFDGSANIAVALASTATTLATARTINGVSFDGSANITTLTAGTGVSVSGTAVSIGQAVATSDSPTFTNLTLNGTDSIKVPAGTTAQRNGSPAAGMLRYNSTTGEFEGYTNAWGAIGGGSGSFSTNIFSGDGSDTTFTLSAAPSNENNLLVFVDGVFQAHNVYSVSGTTLTFATAPANGRVITVYNAEEVSIGTPSDNSVSTVKIVDDAVTSAKIVANAVGITELNVSDGSAGQFLKTDGSGTLSFATVSGTTINNNANNRVITGSGTANTLEGEANFVFDGTNVGIGTSSPSEALTVAGHVDIVNTAININLMETGVTDSNHRIRQNAGNLVIQKLSDDKGTATDRISLDGGTGNVGIGTTSASTLLHLSNASNPAIRITDTTNTLNVEITATDTIGYFGTESNHATAFITNNAEAMRIDTEKNISFGKEKVDPNWSQFFNAISSNYGGHLSFQNNNVPVTSLGNNFYINNSTLNERVLAYPAQQLKLDHQGNFLFENAASGTAGDTFSFTERMRINASGCIGLGTTADRSLGTNITTTVTSGSAGSGFWLSTGNSSATSSKIISTVNGSVGELFIKQGSGVNGGSIIFQINDAEKFRINSNGNCTVAGALSKGSGSFRIDHPLESKKETHHLVHSFVEAPQADNIYRGVVQLENGTATINLDTVSGMSEGTYVLLNTNTSCFTSNETDWDAVKGSVTGNILTINCQNTSSTATVSWLVIGERQDQHMIDTDWTDSDGKVIVEPLKEATK